ncbi:MAG: transporter permease [Paenibacillus sp.]|nr:transporter permease [Paenibacillus sp.]
MATSILGIAFKHIFLKKWRTFFLVVSISLSVGLLSAVLMLKEQMNAGLEELKVRSFGEADLWIGTREKPGNEDSTGINTETIAKLNHSGYVSELGKMIDNPRYLYEIQERLNGGLGVFIAGVDNNRLTKSYYSISKDLGENEMVVSDALAEQLRLHVNDRIALPMPDGSTTNWTVAEIISQSRFRESSGHIALFNLESLQRMIGGEGRVSSVLVRLQPNVNKNAAEPLLRKELGLGSEYLFQTIDTDDRQRLNVVAIQVIMYILMFFALLAAITVLVTVLQTSFRERTVELATIRSIGGSVKQLFALLLVEVGMIALVGVVVGAGSGVVLTQHGSQLVAEVMKVELAKGSIPIGQLLFMSIAMFMITILASLLPLSKAAAADPMTSFKHAFQEDAIDKPSFVLFLSILAASFLTLGITLLLDGGTGWRFILSLLGGGSLCISMVMCLHHFFRPCVSLAIPLLTRLFGPDTRVALTYISINKSRTTLTLFLISISLIVFIPLSFLTALSREENEASLDRIYFRDMDIIIENRHTGFYNPTLPFSLIKELESIAQVEAVIPVLPVIHVNVSGIDFTKSDPAWFEQHDVLDEGSRIEPFRKHELIYVYPTDLRKMVGEHAISEFSTDISRTAVLSKAYAEHLGVNPGELFTISNGNMTDEVVVGAIVERLPYYMSDDRVMLVDMGHPIVTKTDVVDQYFIRTSDPDNGSVISDIEVLQKRYPELRWREKQRELEELNAKTEQILGAIWVTVYVIILSGLIGLFNLLSATIHEKKVEYGILRAIHFTPGQLLKNIMLQSATYAVASIVVGSLIGVTMIVSFFNGIGGDPSADGLWKIYIFPFEHVGYMIGALIVLTLFCSIPMAMRLANRNIIELLARE